MNPLEFLYNLIAKFAPVTRAKAEQLEMEAREWEKETRESENAMLKKYHALKDKWYIRTGLAVIYIFAVRWVADWMAGEKDDSQNDNLTL